jgi:outer membrane protein OmpA-like peptidoglycan-associated protein
LMDGVDKLLRRYPESPVIEDVLGTLDAGEIRARVHELEPETAEIFFFAASVGALFGVVRRDGSRVAIKVHKRYEDDAYFIAVQQVQTALAEAGFPAPRPLGRRGQVTFEEWLDEGVFRDAHEPAVRRAMARELVRFHGLATASGIRPRRPFFPLGVEELWPVPHNALFDFEATVEGAEWIDEIARAAKRARDVGAGVEVVGHTDWSAKHIRFDADLRPVAVYDWDSLDTQPEPLLVGNAAGSFTYTEELEHDVFPWPDARESLAFIEEYEAARGAPFDDEERRAAHGACVYLRAYAARCGHSFGSDVRRESGLTEFAEALL